MQNKYLVTGGAGFIGSHVVDRLLADGHCVVVIDDFSNGKKENLAQHKKNRNLTVYKFSICSKLSSIFKKHRFDGIFHLAALPRVQYSIAYPHESHEANINGTLNLLLAAKEFKVKRFVYSSSSSVYGDQRIPLSETMFPRPISPYALQKYTGEEYCRLFALLYGMETISLRYFNVYGPRQNPDGAYSGHIPKFMKAYCQGTVPTIWGDGEQTRDNTSVHDVVEANVLAKRTTNAKVFGEAFNIGAGRNYSVNQTTKYILELAGSIILPKHGPAVIEPRDTLANTEKARTLLNWKPKVEIQNGLKEMWESFSKIYKK